MGANTFYSAARRDGYSDGFNEEVRGGVKYMTQKFTAWPSAQEAFDSLCATDRHENGHSYSGGIGMKHDFVKIATVDTLAEAEALADKLIDACDPRIDDKWGPAGCIAVGDDHFLFFGWASS